MILHSGMSTNFFPIWYGSIKSMDLAVTRSSSLPNTPVVLSGILMTSSLCVSLGHTTIRPSLQDVISQNGTIFYGITVFW